MRVIRAIRVNRVLLIAAIALLLGCAYKPYQHESLQSFDPLPHAIAKHANGVTVHAFVPGEDQAEALFGFPIYERGIQPVWLQVENTTDDPVRFMPTSVDRFYFSPLEVSYIHRKGYSKEARQAMDIRLYRLSMPRNIKAGETRSGFVFTHASPGSKSFNVDLIGRDVQFQSFHFIVDVQGFKADYSKVDFNNLYRDEQVRNLDDGQLVEALNVTPPRTTNQQADRAGLPVSTLIVSRGEVLLSTLLRGNWSETSMDLRDVSPDSAQHLFSRQADAVFRYHRKNGQVRNELRLWLTPATLDGVPIWAAQIIQFVGHRTQLRDLLFGSVFDPDTDAGRSFLLQNLWYHQGVKQIAWQQSGEASTLDNPQTDFNGTQYFTDGLTTVIWLSETPVPLNSVKVQDWTERPQAR